MPELNQAIDLGPILRELYPRPASRAGSPKYTMVRLDARVVRRASTGDLTYFVDYIRTAIGQACDAWGDYPIIQNNLYLRYDPMRDLYSATIEIGTLATENVYRQRIDAVWDEMWEPAPSPSPKGRSRVPKPNATEPKPTPKLLTRFDIIEAWAA